MILMTACGFGGHEKTSRYVSGRFLLSLFAWLFAAALRLAVTAPSRSFVLRWCAVESILSAAGIIRRGWPVAVRIAAGRRRGAVSIRRGGAFGRRWRSMPFAAFLAAFATARGWWRATSLFLSALSAFFTFCAFVKRRGRAATATAAAAFKCGWRAAALGKGICRHGDRQSAQGCSTEHHTQVAVFHGKPQKRCLCRPAAKGRA